MGGGEMTLIIGLNCPQESVNNLRDNDSLILFGKPMIAHLSLFI